MIFVDTNILVYAAGLSAENDLRITAAREVLAREEPLVVSLPVVQEFYVTATRQTQGRRSLSPREARDLLALWPFSRILPMTIDIFDQATVLEGRYQYSYWDCAILAAARSAGCDVLLSEDMQHGQVIEGVTITNPFRADA